MKAARASLIDSVQTLRDRVWCQKRLEEGGGRRKTGRQVELAKAGQTLAQKRTNDSMDVAGVYL